MNKTQAEFWAPKVHADWCKTLERTLCLGRQLIAAKKACGHGEFLRLFKGNANAVSEPVPFGERTAERLIAIASHSVLSNPAHASDLPHSWGTLYELTKLDKETLIAGIKAGEITPETTRAQAVAMHADPIEKPTKPPHEEIADAVKNAVTRLVGQLTTSQQFEYVRHRLESLLEFLSEQESEHGSRGQRQETSTKRDC